MSDPNSRETLAAKLGQVRQAELNEETFLLALICAYVLLVPTLSFVPSLDPYNEKRALQIGVLIVVAGGLLVFRSARQQWLETFRSLPLAARWGLSGVLVLGGLSSALAPAPFYGFLEVGHFALLFVAAGVVALEVRRAPRWMQQALLGIVAVSGGLYAVYFGVGYGAHLAVPDIKPWPDGGTNYANIRFFNHYQTWTLPLFAGVLLNFPKRWQVGRGLIFGVLALWWALVFASNVRGTIVGMFVAAAGVGLLFRGRAKKWLVLQAISLVGGLALFYALFSAGDPPPVTNKFGRGSPGRLHHWAACLEMMWAHPILGAGPMHFAWFPGQHSFVASPHSTLMQWLAEWGIPSTLIMGSLTVWGGWSWMEQEQATTLKNTGSTDPISVALVASLLAGAAHSMVSGLIVAPLSQMVLVFVGGWAWGRYSLDKGSRSRLSWWPHSVLCIVIAGSIFTVGASLRDLTAVEERREAFLETVDRNALSPRYWTQGYLNVQDSDVIRQTAPD